ncbi:MAG TPA: hypothetical protein DDX33_04775 [Rikenellaceae bacterium]|nr:hypothetical protein [Rikenellaceae bacterium]
MERSLEMDKAKISVLISVVVLCSCGGNHGYTWEKYEIDGHRTGVTAPNADNVPQALGVVDGDKYVSPNGHVFERGSATYSVAADMIDVQPSMAELKTVIGHASKDMIRRGPNCELSNLIVDRLRVDVEKYTGKKVDVAIVNSGGIRVDLPAGDIILDDIVSMLPFKNYICYVALKGSDLQALFESMANNSVQPFSGAKLVVDGHRIDTLLVGGKPIDPNRIYGVGTIDFLLDGGDKLNVGKNAKELIITDHLIVDSILPYIKSFEQQGKPIEYFTDDRLVIKGGNKDE